MRNRDHSCVSVSFGRYEIILLRLLPAAGNVKFRNGHNSPTLHIESLTIHPLTELPYPIDMWRETDSHTIEMLLDILISELTGKIRTFKDMSIFHVSI